MRPQPNNEGNFASASAASSANSKKTNGGNDFAAAANADGLQTVSDNASAYGPQANAGGSYRPHTVRDTVRANSLKNNDCDGADGADAILRTHSAAVAPARESAVDDGRDEEVF
jgi:hypothetical protein